MSYITSADITDKVASRAGFATDIAALILRSDDEVNQLAEERGIFDTTDIVTPIYHKIKQYAIKWVTGTLFVETSGVNNDDFQDEKYRIKGLDYLQAAKDIKKGITKEMFLNTVDSVDELASSQSGRIFHG